MITNEPTNQQTPLANQPDDGTLAQYVDTGLPLPPLPPPSANEPWIKLLLAFFTWFGSVLMLLFVPVILAIPYLMYNWRSRGMPTAEALTADKTFIFISIAGIVPTHLLTLGLVWLVVTEGRRKPFWETIGFNWPRYTNPVVATLMCVFIAAVLLGIGFVVTSFWGGSKTQLDLLVESSIPARFATAFVAVFTAPLIEELVYRGVLYSAIERALGTAVAVGVVALLFAGVHVFQYINNVSVITVITLLSFTLTLVRAGTGKVLPCFIIHLVFNGIQSLIIALSPFINLGQNS
ncbi:MAG TPA: type II CAAX endopeptidase family protein [Pyrinomonadaceae bacterium]|nr:type II CAAX endopeptidase family protein [Pyrinomonadaceae bacterium]